MSDRGGSPVSMHALRANVIAFVAGVLGIVVCNECGRWNYHLASCSRSRRSRG